MRVHVLYTLDDDDPPSLRTDNILDLHSFIVAHRLPHEDLEGKSINHTEEQKQDPHYRGWRAIGRLRAGSFMREDIEALNAYLVVLLKRAATTLAELRFERDRLRLSSPHADRDRAYAGMIDAFASTIARIEGLRTDMLCRDMFEAMRVATPSDRHP